MSRHQRNTWGINFKKESPNTAYNANPPPPCLAQSTKVQYNPAMPNAVGGLPTTLSRPYNSIGKKRIKDDDEYFNEEEETRNDLEYIPGPNSPARDAPENESDGSEDPLDAYMNSIDTEIEKQKNPVTAKKFSQGKRYDIEKEDEIEAYIKFMEQNPHLGAGDDDDIAYEYDNEGNIINKEKKAIEPLPPTEHWAINYQPFEKNFYVQHEDIASLSSGQVAELMKKLGLSVRGMMPPKPVCSFAHFGFDEKLMTVIRRSGFTQPTPIQAQAIPAGLSGRDIIGVAKTGSGKTAAFIWPMIFHIIDQPELKLGDGPIGLICAPTRELALQIYQEAMKYGKVYNIGVVCAYGGGNMYEQQKACEAGCEILVCTPGRLIDMIKKKSTNLRRVTFLVFDEADKMFNLGFEPQVNSISKNVRPDRQTLLFSATFKYKVEKLARDALNDPIKIVQGQAGEANEDVTQTIQVLNKEDEKFFWLHANIVDFTSQGSVLIFTTRKVTSVELAAKLLEKGQQCLLIHGDVHQIDRNQIIASFKKGEVKILVATDVAARGLDIAAIKTVVNYDVARDIDTHTHRVGRTGRAGAKGCAFTLVTRERDKEFAGHLVRNLEGASQQVPSELLALANQSSWFKKSRNNMNKEGKKISGNMLRRRAGLGSSSLDDGNDSPPSRFGRKRSPEMITVIPRGPQTDRLSTMRAAFNSQYQRMFVSAGVDGSVYTHPERLGDQDHPTQPAFSAPSPPPLLRPAPGGNMPPPASSGPHGDPAPPKKKTRWGATQ